MKVRNTWGDPRSLSEKINDMTQKGSIFVSCWHTREGVGIHSVTVIRNFREKTGRCSIFVCLYQVYLYIVVVPGWVEVDFGGGRGDHMQTKTTNHRKWIGMIEIYAEMNMHVQLTCDFF